MQKLKEVVRRGTAFAAAVSLLAGTVVAALPRLASADALNPLTERTLLLSSSAPGYVDTDGSGNGTYAPPNSGPNGKKTGETFTFKVSTDSSGAGPKVKALTFQFCTVAAGLCTSPGDDASATVPGTDDSSHSDLNANYPSPAEITTWPVTDTNSDGSSTGVVNRDNSEGNFAVLTSPDSGTTWNLSSGWSMNNTTDNPNLVTNLEDGASPTGKNNFITLTNSTGIGPTAGEEVKVIFYATDTNYITNPGSGAFFVKINDYNNVAIQDFRDNYPLANKCNPDGTYTDGTGTSACTQNVIDGGVTVANVMNNSIQIHTKVLETLDFSVGTHDPTTDSASPGPCDAVDDGSGTSGGVLNLGDSTAENSLSTHTAYDTFSYWRLSSNSSNGATVYYSGNTLANTEGDIIHQIYDLKAGDGGTPGDNSGEYSHIGSEQFGLGLDVTYQTGIDSQGDNGYVADYNPADSKDGNGANSTQISNVSSAFSSAVSSNNPSNDYFNSWHLPQLFPLVPMGSSTIHITGTAPGDNPNGTLSYGLANGSIGTSGAGARFAFSKTANTIPVPIASESNLVVNCATGLMRYVGNIAATTPAGIYTTAINYLAAPEY